MQVQREFDDRQLVQRIENMPIDELRKSLGLEPKDENKISSQPSKWAKIAEEAHKTSPLHGISESVMEDVKEFRRGFQFKHDKE